VTPYDAWRAGLCLERAFDRWGGGAAWTRQHAWLLAQFDLLRMERRSPLIDRPAAAVRLQSMGGAWDDHERRYVALRDAFRERLRRGDLLAIGFTAAGGGTQRLAILPPASWSPESRVDWARSRVTVDANLFLDVRVVKPEGAQVDGDVAARRITAG
jgi:hypothetical protein